MYSIDNGFRVSFTKLLAFMIVIGITFVSCQDSSTSVQEEKEALPEIDKATMEKLATSYQDLVSNRSNVDKKGNSFQAVVNVVTYNFDDLGYNCYWQYSPNFPNPYHDLEFVNQASWAICGGYYYGGNRYIIPARRSSSYQFTTDIIILPNTATQVSLDMYHYRYNTQAALIAYDADGNEITRATTNRNIYSWEQVTVTANEPIYRIGIYAHNPNTNIDNLIVHYGSTNEPPVADAGEDQVVEATGPTTTVTLDGTGSSDPDGDELSYSWTLGGLEVSTDASFDTDLALGTHTFTLTVDDGNGETATDEVVVEVQDTTAPELSYAILNTQLWPANHKMHVVVDNISASDIVDANPALEVTVSSNEAVNGKGSGNTDSDWEVNQLADGSYEVIVRAERSGKGSGRTYTITITGTDASGNTVVEEVEVSVAKSQGRS